MSSHGTVAASPATDSETDPEIRDLVALCDLVLGHDLTAYLAGARSARDFSDQVAGAAPVDGLRRRLGIAADVIDAFAAHNRAGAAAAWLRDTPRGGGACVARLIREFAEDELADKDIPEAAAAFAAR